jgi:hypothetical protein
MTAWGGYGIPPAAGRAESWRAIPTGFGRWRDVPLVLPTDHQELLVFKDLQQRVRPTYTEMPNGDQWVKTEPLGSEQVPSPVVSSLAKSAKKVKREIERGPVPGSWKVTVVRSGKKIEERIYYPQKQQVEIRCFGSDSDARVIVGEIVRDTQIVFSTVPPTH